MLTACQPTSVQEGDTTGQKLGGALLNAVIFIGVVAVMTFILVLLFKYGVSAFAWLPG